MKLFSTVFSDIRPATAITCLWLAWVLCCSPDVYAAPNGLTQIPIAKVFGDGVASFSVARAVQSTQTTTYTTQYGIDNNFEVGVDYQAAPPDDATFLGNVKYLLAHNPGHIPDIAIGMANVATGQKAVLYAVATTQPKALGISLGVIRPDGSPYEGWPDCLTTCRRPSRSWGMKSAAPRTTGPSASSPA